MQCVQYGDTCSCSPSQASDETTASVEEESTSDRSPDVHRSLARSGVVSDYHLFVGYGSVTCPTPIIGRHHSEHPSVRLLYSDHAVSDSLDHHSA